MPGRKGRALPKNWSNKSDRQYEHIKKSAKKQSTVAENINLLHALFLLMTFGCLNWKVLAKQCTD